jgi:hypothetical protein
MAQRVEQTVVPAERAAYRVSAGKPMQADWLDSLL